jgi:phage terminase large subunit GpA-like protein
MDSGGHHTQDVYAYSKARLGRRIYAIHGASEVNGKRNPVWPTKVPLRKNKAGFRPVTIGGNTARDVVRARLAVEPPALPGTPTPGYCHFPVDRDVVYFEQLLADRLTIKEVGVQRFRIWVTPPGRANEASDCRVYAYAALCGLYQAGLQLNRRAAAVQQRRVERAADAVPRTAAGAASAPPSPAASPAAPAPPPSAALTPAERIKRIVARIAS